MSQTYLNQWLERTLDDSAIKRIIYPECFLLLEHILNESIKCISSLVINENKITNDVLYNMPFILSEQIILNGVELGYNRQDIHERLRIILTKLKSDSSQIISNDNTLEKLRKYQIKNPKLQFYINPKQVSQFRTHRIAYARNYCISQIKEKYADYPYFIMMDFDDPNCKNCNIFSLQKYLKREDWDGLSFNTSPKYYDIWGLSIYPYCFSYNHFRNNNLFYNIIQDYVDKKLKNLKKDELLQCISSFNGFSIYRTTKFLNTYYDGRVRTDLFPPEFIKTHSNAQKSRGLVYRDYGHIKGLYEDCEHRSFHVQAMNKNNAKIMIAPEVIFS
jgi:hypothetical protein